MTEYIAELDFDYDGTESCSECGQEFDFIYNPMKHNSITCPHCKTVQPPCTLCDPNMVLCGGKSCAEKIIYVLREYNKSEE